MKKETCYKLTTKNMQTHHGFQWVLGKGRNAEAARAARAANRKVDLIAIAHKAMEE